MRYKKSIVLPFLFSAISLVFKTRLITDFLTYSIGALLMRGISFFTLPLIMHKIAPSQYGTFSLLTAFIIITTAIMGLGLRQLLSIEYFHATKTGQEHLISDIISIYTVFALPAIIIVWYARHIIIAILFFGAVTPLQFGGTLIIIFLFFYSELMYQLMQYRRLARQLIILQSFIGSIVAMSSLYSVFYLNAGITGMVWSQAIGSIIANMVAVVYFVRLRIHHQSPLNRLYHTPYYLLQGLPFIPSIIANWILSSSDRWILGYYTTMENVGIYATADLVSQIFYVVVLQSWAASYLPYIMQRYSTHPNNIPHIESENRRIMWITMIGCALTISVGYPIAHIVIQKLIPPCYFQSLRYVWVLLMGQVFLLGNYFASALLQYKKRIYFLASALFIPGLLNLILNIIVTPIWGIMGCAIATLISYIIYFMITYLYNKKIMMFYQKKGVS